jgi:hypothetical protein
MTEETMNMLGQAQQAFLEADVAYQRQRLIDGMHRTHRTSQPRRTKWVQGLIDAVSNNHRRDPRQGAIRWEGDGPITRPIAAPHHATSH